MQKKRFIKISEDTALRLSSCLPPPPLRRLNLIHLMQFPFKWTGRPVRTRICPSNGSRAFGRISHLWICLGHQILTHAIGASTYKLKFGHRVLINRFATRRPKKSLLLRKTTALRPKKKLLRHAVPSLRNTISMTKLFQECDSWTNLFFRTIPPGGSTWPNDASIYLKLFINW